MDDAVAVADASEAIRLAPSDARAARRLAVRALSAATLAGDPHGESMAERALGLAELELGRAQAAVEHLRRAVEIGDRAGLAVVAGQARTSLAWALALRGAGAAALVEVERATAVLRGGDGARAEAQRAALLHKLGRFDLALSSYRRALAALRRHGDRLWEARLLCNRGVLQVYRGELGAAEEDFERSAALHAQLGNALAVTQVRHNLGWVAARRGDVPGALQLYDRVEAEYAAHDVPLGLLLLDRSEVLVAARLPAEARSAAERAVRELTAERMEADAAEARLLLARADLLDGDAVAAGAHARAAREAFTRQRRVGWAALARGAELRSRWLSGERSPALLRTAERTAAALEASGWSTAALDARLVAGRTALALGRTGTADRCFARAARARRRGPLELRVHAWHAEALRRSAHGDVRGARAAVAAGLRALETHRATLGASELRAQAAGHGEDLALLGVRLALGTGRARAVLAAAERCRAGALWSPPVRPPDDAALAAALAELRTVARDAEQALLEGRDAAALERRREELERDVRRRARAASGTGAVAAPPPPPDPPALAEALGERALLELVAVDGALHAVVVAGGRASLRALGPLTAVTDPLHVLRFALPRLAARHGTPRALAALARSAAAAAADLDRALLDRVRDRLGDRPLVVVPTGALHGVPWAALPSCAGRAVVVAASAGLWLRAERARRPGWQEPARVALVTGPGLPAAEQEVGELAAAYPGARVLIGGAATADATATALEAARCAHLAMHGRFRADNPHLSSLVLADGPLSVYDLEGLARVPEQIVLSACESGRSDVRTGDELMGLAAALLALGTTTIVASLAPVPDADTRALMLAVHEALRAGTEPAAALAGAQARLAGAGAGCPPAFVCLGAG